MGFETLVYIDLQYFTNIYYFKKVCINTNVVFPSFENYLKTGFSNRCRIAGANGPILLSVPLEKGRNQRAIFKEVRICNEEKWQLRHWKSICSSYNSSPWFNHYTDDLSGLFFRKFEWLIDWNLTCLDWIVRKFNLQLTVSNLPAPPLPEAQPTVTDLRRRSVDVKDQEFPEIRYVQVFQEKFGFIPDLSVLDLLFCAGPKTGLALLR